MTASVPVKIVVPVSSPAHPSHKAWLDILLKVIAAASVIGPAVIEIADPKDAALAAQLGHVAQVVTAAEMPQL